jgi:hypothetical protein
MLPRTTYDLTFTDGTARHGVLHCNEATALVVRIDLPSASRDGEPEDLKIAISVGKIRSAWTGALDHIRACADPADRDGPKVQSVELPSEQGVTCRLSPEQRVLALDAAVLAPGRSLSAAESRLSRACLDRVGSLEIAGIAQGVEVKLPAGFEFADLRVPLQGRAGTVVVPQCAPGQTLRAVALEVKDDPRFELGAVRVNRIDGATGVTCDPPQKMSDRKRTCELTRTALTCAAAPLPKPPLREVDCSIDESNYLKPRATCRPCRREVVTIDWKDEAARNGFSCRSICRCE